MPTLLGIAGSLRRGSFNASLLRAAAEMAPEGTHVEIASIRDIAPYDGDVETEQGIPRPVAELKDRIAACDGLLIVTPEYNHSVPGALKNAIDWLSRPPADIPRVFGGKPVAIMGATTGPGGTRMSQTALLPVWRALGARPWFGKQLYVNSAAQVFDAGGKLVDEKIARLVREFMAAYATEL